MSLQHIVSVLRKFYPPGISGFHVDYYSTPETINKNRVRLINDPNWDKFLMRLKESFPRSIIEDRTDDSVANIVLIYLHEPAKTIQFVLHISKLISYYCYYINYFDEVDASKNLKANWNFTPSDYLAIEVTIKNAIEQFYTNYKILPAELLDEIIPEYSTPGYDLGFATIFNLVFTDHSYP